MLDSLLQDLRYAGRVSLRAPGLTIAAILALAIGIGANTAIFTIVNAVLLERLPFRDPDFTHQDNRNGSLTPAQARRRQSPQKS